LKTATFIELMTIEKRDDKGTVSMFILKSFEIRKKTLF